MAAELGRMREEDLVFMDLFKVESLAGDCLMSEADWDFPFSWFPLGGLASDLGVLEAELFPSVLGLDPPTIMTLGLLCPVELVDLLPFCAIASFVICVGGWGADIFLDGGFGGRAAVKDFLLDRCSDILRFPFGLGVEGALALPRSFSPNLE